MKLRNGKQYKYHKYRILTWICLFSSRNQDWDFCTPVHAHGICKSEFLRLNFKYRISRLCRNQIPIQERLYTQIQLPAHNNKYYCKLQQRGPWDLDVILSEPFTIYYN